MKIMMDAKESFSTSMLECKMQMLRNIVAWSKNQVLQLRFNNSSTVRKNTENRSLFESKISEEMILKLPHENRALCAI